VARHGPLREQTPVRSSERKLGRTELVNIRLAKVTVHLPARDWSRPRCRERSGTHAIPWHCMPVWLRLCIQDTMNEQSTAGKRVGSLVLWPDADIPSKTPPKSVGLSHTKQQHHPLTVADALYHPALLTLSLDRLTSCSKGLHFFFSSSLGT